MWTILFILSLSCISYCLRVQDFDQFISSTPTTFGLLTVTHARNGDYSYFKTHLNMYAKMQCSQITEISVVWNNDLEPAAVGFVQDSSWKRPVYFIKTPHNSMDFRYGLPEQSLAQVFYSIDDDVIITCHELRKSFKYWRQMAVGDIGPLVTYGPRGWDYSTKTENYTYTDPLKQKYFSLSLIGICWVSRLYLELYSSQKLQIMKPVHQLVQQVNNCDDIALNFLVNYFFPQFVAIFFNGQMKMKTQPSSQSVMKNHYVYRNGCLGKFTTMFGLNTLRIVNKLAQHPKLSIVDKYSIFKKKQELISKYLTKATDSANQQMTLKNPDLKTELQVEIKSILQTEAGLDMQVKTQQGFIEDEISKDIVFALNTKQALQKKLVSLKTLLQKNQLYTFQKLQSENIASDSLFALQKLKKTLKTISILVIISTILMTCLVYQFCRVCCQKQKSDNFEQQGQNSVMQLNIEVGKQINKHVA